MADLPTLHTEPLNVLSFSPDGLFLATGASDGRLIVHSIPSLKLDLKLVHSQRSPVLCLSWISNAAFLVGFQSGEIYILERFPSEKVGNNALLRYRGC
jgi:WD40 repeat protein